MVFLYTREHLEQGDFLVVQCSHHCKIRITTDSHFSRLKQKARYESFGGFYRSFPAKIAAPTTGYWNIIIDIDSGSEAVTYTINVIKNSSLLHEKNTRDAVKRKPRRGGQGFQCAGVCQGEVHSTCSESA